MDGPVKPAKSEKILLAVTAAFCCFVLALFLHGRAAAPAEGYTVRTQTAAAAESVVPAERKVNLNTASAAELAELPGIGETLAARIVAYRERSGGFQTAEEIKKVNGIGEGKYKAIRSQITVDGEENG